MAVLDENIMYQARRSRRLSDGKAEVINIWKKTVVPNSILRVPNKVREPARKVTWAAVVHLRDIPYEGDTLDEDEPEKSPLTDFFPSPVTARSIPRFPLDKPFQSPRPAKKPRLDVLSEHMDGDVVFTRQVPETGDQIPQISPVTSVPVMDPATPVGQTDAAGASELPVAQRLSEAPATLQEALSPVLQLPPSVAGLRPFLHEPSPEFPEPVRRVVTHQFLSCAPQSAAVSAEGMAPATPGFGPERPGASEKKVIRVALRKKIRAAKPAIVKKRKTKRKRRASLRENGCLRTKAPPLHVGKEKLLVKQIPQPEKRVVRRRRPWNELSNQERLPSNGAHQST